jgi:hypothetical protein
VSGNRLAEEIQEEFNANLKAPSSYVDQYQYKTKVGRYDSHYGIEGNHGEDPCWCIGGEMIRSRVDNARWNGGGGRECTVREWI